MSGLRMNSALRGRREIAGMGSILWRPTQAGQGSVSKRNQLVLGFLNDAHTLEDTNNVETHSCGFQWNRS